jgi:hypothetical protein
MLLLISTPLHILLVDVESKQVSTLRSGDGYYYGISYQNETFVLSHTGGYLQYFGAGKKATRTENHLLQPHQVEWIDNYVLVANTGRNCVTVFDERGSLCNDIYLNDIRWDDKDRGRFGNHFNSVHRFGEKVYVVAHNYERPSEVWELSWPGLQVLGATPSEAAWAHNVWPSEIGLVVCDSKNGGLYDVLSNTTIWKSDEENAITRGLAASDDYIFVGYSMINERKNRYWKNGGVWIVDRKTLKTIDKITFLGSGDVHEIRLVGLPDACHNGQTIPLHTVEQINRRSPVINLAYYLRKQFPVLRKDLFPLSQIVRGTQLINRGNVHLRFWGKQNFRD